MTVSQLIEALSKLPPHKSVLCQVVGKTGTAWNMHYQFQDVENTAFVQLRVFHPELNALPRDGWNGEKD